MTLIVDIKMKDWFSHQGAHSFMGDTGFTHVLLQKINHKKYITCFKVVFN